MLSYSIKQYIKYIYYGKTMKLTVLTDYALRLLMHVAVQDGRLVTIAQTATRYGISKNHLMKVAHQLAKAGYLQTVRGRSGGLRLARAAEHISIGEVVRHLEQNSILVDCFPGGKGTCHIVPVCRLKGALAEAQEAFFAVLDKVSLAELINENEVLTGLLLEPAS